MKKNKNLIFIELNELNFDIVKKYSKKYNFKFFNKDFFLKLKITHSENKYENLEPWIQWVSVHTGKSAKDHGIKRLGDIKHENSDQIFEVIEDLGFDVGAISPMNAMNKMKNPSYFISDPWTNGGVDKYSFHNLLSRTLSRTINSNSKNKILFKDYFILILSIFKFARIKNYKQYILFFFLSLKHKWYKAIFLDLLLNDIHIKLLKKFKTNFSTIFFNAGAHIQHHYFFNSEFVKNNLRNPTWYLKKNYDPLKDIIFFYDDILFEYSKLNKYKILIATGLSQIPYDRKKFYYRLKNHENFLNLCGIKFKKVLPRMTRDFLVEFYDKNSCRIAEKKFHYINKINNKIIFIIDNRGYSLFITLAISTEVFKNYYLNLNRKYKIKLIDHVSFVALKNGMHCEKGYFWSSDASFELTKSKLKHVKNLHSIILNYFKN